jgi:hypothetical protein
MGLHTIIAISPVKSVHISRDGSGNIYYIEIHSLSKTGAISVERPAPGNYEAFNGLVTQEEAEHRHKITMETYNETTKEA